MQHVKNNSITLLSDTFHLAVLKIIPIAKAIPHRVGKACISPGCSITKCGAVSASIINTLLSRLEIIGPEKARI